MDWHELVNDALPPQRGDEPGSLRQDIADELADHFACALRREQLRLGDEDAAHQAAMDKFGDPKWLAYRLWFDAMKESIMKDRVMIGAVAVMAAAVVGVTVMVFSMMGRQQDAMEQVLSAMKQMQAQTQDSGLPFGWTEMQVQLLTADGQEPVEGATVELSGYLLSETEQGAVRRESDAEGMVRFEAVRMGTHEMYVILPDGRIYSRDVELMPVQDAHVEVVYCPGPLERTSVHLDVPWPDGWDELGVVAEYHFEFRTDLQMDGYGPATRWVDGVFIRLSADGTGEIEWPISTRPRTAGTENVAFDPRDGELPCGTYELNNVILRLEVQGRRPPQLGASEAIVQPRGTNDVTLGLRENVRPELSFEVTVAGANEIVLPIPRALREGMDEVLDRLDQR